MRLTKGELEFIRSRADDRQTLKLLDHIDELEARLEAAERVVAVVRKCAMEGTDCADAVDAYEKEVKT